MVSQGDPELEGARLLTSHGGHSANGSRHRASAFGTRARKAFRHCVEHEPLLLATLVGVAVGIVLGTALSFANLSPTALEIIGLPGDLLMRLLKMLVLPLITASVMAGVCALRQSTADMGKVARYTLLYYFSTTMGAVVLGIAIVNIVRPGRNAPFDQLDPSSGGGGGCHAANQQKVASHAASTSQHSPIEAFLGVIKSAFPDNIFQAAATMNVLGIITVSLLMGAALSSMGPEAGPMVTLINIFNDAIGKIVNWVIWTSPVGIASLITTSICRACNLAATLEALGLFIVAVLLGLLVWGFLVLPAIYYATTRRNPGQVYRGFSQAMATAFGTDSSNATLPITMRSAVDLGCDPRIVQFFLPLGTTVNMNGTALYEAVTVIFIAQAHGVQLGAAGTVIVALTATLAAVGAAGIPSAGLVTMLMVLQAVDLEQFAGDIAIILAVDWFLDRCRTVVNVLGDSFGTVIIDHHARKWVAAKPATAPTGAPGKEASEADAAVDPAGTAPGAAAAAAAGTAAVSRPPDYLPIHTADRDLVSIELTSPAAAAPGPGDGTGSEGLAHVSRPGPAPGAAPWPQGPPEADDMSMARAPAGPERYGTNPHQGDGNYLSSHHHHHTNGLTAHTYGGGAAAGIGERFSQHVNHHHHHHHHQHGHHRPAGQGDEEVRQRLLVATSLEDGDLDGVPAGAVDLALAGPGEGGRSSGASLAPAAALPPGAPGAPGAPSGSGSGEGLWGLELHHRHPFASS